MEHCNFKYIGWASETIYDCVLVKLNSTELKVEECLTLDANASSMIKCLINYVAHLASLKKSDVIIRGRKSCKLNQFLMAMSSICHRY